MAIPSTVFKAQATGNDFVMYHDPEGVWQPTDEETGWLCDRHFGVGADGLLRLTDPRYVSDLSAEQRKECARGGATWFMDYRNADGSLAEMCGNGTRAITFMARRLGLTDADGTLRLGTRAGVKIIRPNTDHPELGDDVFTVDMGTFLRGDLGGHRVTIPEVMGMGPGTYVDMGNPHIVVVVGDDRKIPDGHGEIGSDDERGNTLRALLRDTTLPDVPALDLSRKPVVEPALPHGKNVEFVRIREYSTEEDRGAATMRVHERGVGETLSCGTGLCATAITLQALTGVRHWRITVPGGLLQVDVDERTSRVWLTGPAHITGSMALEPR